VRTKCAPIRRSSATDSVNFALLNRGKRSIAIDLKESGALARLRPIVEITDVVVEQFRPGVMDPLGLAYEALRAINRGIIYCAITGYGQATAQVSSGFIRGITARFHLAKFRLAEFPLACGT